MNLLRKICILGDRSSEMFNILMPFKSSLMINFFKYVYMLFHMARNELLIDHSVSWYSALELRQGSSEEVPPSSNVSALWISWRFRGAGRIRWSAGCPCRFFFILQNPTLTAGYERLSFAFLCRSLLPGLERLPKALNGFFMSPITCFWLAIFDYARLSLAFLCRSHPPQLPTAVMEALSGFFTPCT